MNSMNSTTRPSEPSPKHARVPQAVLELLRCPISRTPLRYDDQGRLVCASGLHAYPVIEGLPVLTPEAARSSH